MDSTRKLFTGWLKDHPTQELHYEDLMEGPVFNNRVAATFTGIFEREPSNPLTTEYVKVAPPLRTVIENADAVLEAFGGDEYEHFVEEALTPNAVLGV